MYSYTDVKNSWLLLTEDPGDGLTEGGKRY